MKPLLILFSGLALWSCSEPAAPTLFEERALTSGIDFRNDLEENEEQNIVDYLYFYNGAGVAVADFNQDGFEDIYFVKNHGKNTLYWNRGEWQFEEGAGPAGVTGAADFQTGVAVTDLNNDGFPDIYISSVHYLQWRGSNELYLNNGDGTFSEQAADLGLDFMGYGQQAYFFDADNDGDQDLYLLRHSVHPTGGFNNASQRQVPDSLAGDLFLLNTGSASQPHFEDKTAEFGILSSQIGYGLSAAVEDFNGDGYLDLFVANDFHENDYLYLNQGGERFQLASQQAFRTNSKFTMGCDAKDLNGDQLPDLFTLDMKPWDEVERKNALGPEPFPIHKYKRTQGYVEQFPKNSLHLSAGVLEHATVSFPVFEDVASRLHMESTDWSWGILLEDFDGDDLPDAFITNGIKRRPNDLDYIQFLSSGGGGSLSDRAIYEKMPSGQTANRAFQLTWKDGSLQAEERSAHWGLDYLGTSNGAAFGDFDNDGKWDLVVNNLDGPALLYQNKLGTPKTTVDFGGRSATYKKRPGAREYRSLGTRGWLSHSSTRAAVDHFGGSILVRWANGPWEAFTLLPGECNRLRPGAGAQVPVPTEPRPTPALPRTFSTPDTLPFAHREDSYTSFVKTPLLIEGTDELGPAAAFFQGKLFVGGSFREAPIWADPQRGWDTALVVKDKEYEDVDAGVIRLGNGDSALVVVTGSSQLPNNSWRQRDRMYLDAQTSQELSAEGSNAAALAILDMNGDGIEDLFIGERCVWDNFGAPPAHALYLGSPSGALVKQAAPTWAEPLGMVTDLCVVDLNGDGSKELLVATDWGPVYCVYFEGRAPRMEALTANGWWRHVSVADLNGDGRWDIVAGGFGENHGINVKANEPIELFIKDLDGNGDRDFVYSYYNHGKRYPLFGRDELIKESVRFRKQFLHNRAYAGRELDQIFGSELDDAQHLSVSFTGSVALLSQGDRYQTVALPSRAQQAPLRASLAVGPTLYLAGGSNATNTLIGTQEGFCGMAIEVKTSDSDDGVLLWETQPFPTLLRGSVAQMLPYQGGVVALMNDGPALYFPLETHTP